MKQQSKPKIKFMLMWLSDKSTMGQFLVKTRKEAKQVIIDQYNITKENFTFGQIVYDDDSRLDIMPKFK